MLALTAEEAGAALTTETGAADTAAVGLAAGAGDDAAGTSVASVVQAPLLTQMPAAPVRVMLGCETVNS